MPLFTPLLCLPFPPETQGTCGDVVFNILLYRLPRCARGIDKGKVTGWEYELSRIGY